MPQSTSRVGKRGTVVIPAALRRRFGIEEGSLVIAEDREEGILIRPALAVPLETYSQERKAQFLLSNAVDTEDYARAEEEEVLGSVEVVLTAAPTDRPLFSTMELADKDRPVLLGGIGVGATHLLTGDF